MKTPVAPSRVLVFRVGQLGDMIMTLPALWAPVGLRYHGLHHLLPSVPYHALGEAHRRLCAELGEDSVYHASSHRGLVPLVARLAASTWRGQKPR